MDYKAKLMDEKAVGRSLARITHEIIEKNRGAEDICLLGIKRRGVPLSRVLQRNIEKFEGVAVPAGEIDITFYREDLTRVDDMPIHTGGVIPFDINDKKVILVDDVIYTGRTARAAIEAVFAHGRPRSIQLAVLVDRGHRELPIRPDFVGKNIPTAKSEVISVKTPEFDGECGVYLCDAAQQD